MEDIQDTITAAHEDAAEAVTDAANAAGDDGAANEQRDELDMHGLFEAILFLSNDPVPISFFV